MNLLKQDDIHRMIKEAEAFAEQDAELKKRIERLNELSTFVWHLKSQVADSDGLGGKLSDNDKKTLGEKLTQFSTWLELSGRSATMDEIEERFANVQAVVNPITSALYRGSNFQEGDWDYEREDAFKHTEL